MEFREFAKIINQKFMDMAKGQLFVVQQDRNTIWDAYQSAYPEGTNPIYKTRAEHDCQICKQFIRNIGGVVAINNGEIQTIWDVEGLQDEYKVVAEKLNEFVKTLPIANILLKQEHRYGLLKNVQITEAGSITWEHFQADIPNKFYHQFPDTRLGEVRTNKELLERGMELSIEAVDTVLELISQNSLYRGEEHKPALVKFLELKREHQNISSDKLQTWLWSKSLDPAVRFKNTVIGTLVQDISEGMELDRAVASFESKVAPQNYKRTSAVITQGMINQAMVTINELGIEPALHRRYAEASDISVNNVLFADRSTSVVMKDSVSSLLSAEVKPNVNLSKVEEISIDDFISDVLPKISSMELMVTNQHAGNLMSVVAPKDTCENILKWDNNFSWAYNGGVTDSIKQRVKEAGGNIEGALRISLSWINDDDLDLHVIEPSGEEIYFSHTRSRTNGKLDVDMRRGGRPDKPSVENIYWVNESDLQNGNYKVMVHQYSKNTPIDQGYTVEVEYDGVITQYSMAKNPANNKTDTIVTIKKSGGNVEFSVSGATKGSVGKDIWNIKTETFQKVNMVMLSPNHWDGQSIGNKHWFFIMDECRNPENIIGLYNEFLSDKLTPHRKVFEVLGSKLRCEYQDDQLSGLGFSSTKRDSVICKVSGTFSRTLKINF